MGNYLVARSLGSTSYTAWTFNGEAVAPDTDFDWRVLLADDPASAGTQIARASYVVDDGAQSDERLGSPVLTWLWKKALDEWA